MAAKRPRSHETPPDAPQYVQTWARDILAALGKRGVRRLLGDYKIPTDQITNSDPKVVLKVADADINRF